MTWQEFVASLVESLAWPATLVVLVAFLRREIKAVMPGLKSLRYGDFAMEFARRVEELEEGLDRDVGLPAAGEELAQEGDEKRDVALLPETQASATVASLTPATTIERLASISPRAAVSEAWIQVEQALRQLASKRDISTEVSTHRLIRSLASHDVISAETVAILNELRALRNEAIHHADTEITPDGAREYADVSLRIRNDLVDLLTDYTG